MEAIRTWLNNGRDFDTGVILYDTYGDDPAVKRMLAQGQSPHRQQQLVERLRAILKAADTITLPTAKDEPPEKIVVQTPKMPEYKGKETQDPYYDLWQPAYIQMNALRHKLLLAPNDEERGKMCFEILNLERTCKHYWDRRDYLAEHGHEMPEEKVKVGLPPTVDVNAMQKELQNLRTYVSRYRKECKKKGIKEQDHEKLQMYLEKMLQLEKELGYERKTAN